MDENEQKLSLLLKQVQTLHEISKDINGGVQDDLKMLDVVGDRVGEVRNNISALRHRVRKISRATLKNRVCVVSVCFSLMMMLCVLYLFLR